MPVTHDNLTQAEVEDVPCGGEITDDMLERVYMLGHGVRHPSRALTAHDHASIQS